MGINDVDVDQQKYLAAYDIAAAQADAWAEVRDRRLRAAVSICQDDLKMSLRATAKELSVSKSTLARHYWNTMRPAEPMSGRASEFEDEILIGVGLGQLASPQARFAAGLITEFERDGLLDSDRRRQMPIPAQIREAVEKFPGIANLDLPRMIEMAIPKGTVPDLRRHAETARCKVDVDGQWWLARPLGELESGIQIPLSSFAQGVVRSEWVTITNVSPALDHPDAIDVDWIRDDGKTTGQWPNTDPSLVVAYRNP